MIPAREFCLSAYVTEMRGDYNFVKRCNQGRFHRLFNILLPADDPSHKKIGVPDNHELLKPIISEHIIPGTLPPDNFCSAGVTTLDPGGLGYQAERLLGFISQVSCHLYSLDRMTQGRSCFRAERSKAQYYHFQYKPSARIPYFVIVLASG